MAERLAPTSFTARYHQTWAIAPRNAWYDHDGPGRRRRQIGAREERRGDEGQRQQHQRAERVGRGGGHGGVVLGQHLLAVDGVRRPSELRHQDEEVAGQEVQVRDRPASCRG